MRTNTIVFLLVISFIVMTSSICKQQENLDDLKTNLNTAIEESKPFEIAKLINKLRRADADLKTLPLDKAADQIWPKVYYAYQWEPFNGQEVVQLFGPFEGLYDNTWRENVIRSGYFWGLMDTGRRKKALELWDKAEAQVASLLAKPWPKDRSKLTKEEIMNLTNMRWSYWVYIMGFMSSKDQQDKLQGVELAKRYYDWDLSSKQKDVIEIQFDHPAAQAQIKQVLTDTAYTHLVYALVGSGMVTDPEMNPFLIEQPETNIQFRLVKNAGFEKLSSKTTIYNCIALGDYDGDNYVDVLIPGQGLWRNLEGRGKFKRVDEGLEVNIDGKAGAFADVNNDGLVDIMIVGPDKFEISLQTQKNTFQSVKEVSNFAMKNPGGIGLLDGDADGFIDVYISGDETSDFRKGFPDVVLRNKGDGTFENVTEAWGFTEDDITKCGRGVSPGDYDNDGYSDIYISNYRLDRNTLWHHLSEKGPAIFVQCASAPLFGKGERPEVLEGIDLGIEGRQGVHEGTTYWGHTSGSVWGDINSDGTLDLVCANLAHPREIRLGVSDVSRVYLNRGSTFEDGTLNAGLVFRETSEDPLLADFNNDGVLDLNIINCYRPYVNQFYEGIGDGRFKEVTFRTGAFAFNAVGQASGDFDNDGDLDWFVRDGNRGILLYENKLIDNGRESAAAHWIQIKLQGGEQINSMAYGARVTLRTNDRTLVREVAGMRGGSNCDDQIVHFGLGDYTGKVDVEVRWIGDIVQEASGLDINQRHVIIEGNGK